MIDRDEDEDEVWAASSEADWDDEVDSWDEDDDDATIDCPYCGAAIHEDSVRCPHCEQYLSDEDAPASALPWWIVTGVIAVLAIVGWWVLGS